MRAPRDLFCRPAETQGRSYGAAAGHAFEQTALIAVAIAADAAVALPMYVMAAMSHENGGGFGVIDAFFYGMIAAWAGVLVGLMPGKLHVVLRLALCAAPALVAVGLWAYIGFPH